MAERTKTRYDRAVDAATELFSDTSVSRAETRELLRDLRGEIDTMLDTLGTDND